MVIELDVRFRFSSAGGAPKSDVCKTHDSGLWVGILVALVKGLMTEPVINFISTLFGG